MERKMNENSRIYDLVIAAMQSGFADEAMNAAREAGAAGGTPAQIPRRLRHKFPHSVSCIFSQFML